MGIPKGAKVWIPNRRDGNGCYFHRDPDGRRWYGTPAEVREAVLMPWRRDMLARELRFIRSYAEDYGTDRETLAEREKAQRREARQAGSDGWGGGSVTIPADTYIRLVAGARLVRDNFDEYLAELWNSEISAFLEVAESDTGKREIPMTRYELAALARLARV